MIVVPARCIKDPYSSVEVRDLKTDEQGYKNEIFLVSCKCDFSYLALRNTAYINHSYFLSFMIVLFFFFLVTLKNFSSYPFFFYVSMKTHFLC